MRCILVIHMMNDTSIVSHHEASLSAHSRLMCLVESRGTVREVGFSSLDLQTATCIVGQFSDTSSFHGLCRQVLMLQPELVYFDQSLTFSRSY
jgi:hypothetical protein